MAVNAFVSEVVRLQQLPQHFFIKGQAKTANILLLQIFFDIRVCNPVTCHIPGIKYSDPNVLIINL